MFFSRQKPIDCEVFGIFHHFQLIETKSWKHICPVSDFHYESTSKQRHYFLFSCGFYSAYLKKKKKKNIVELADITVKALYAGG